MSEFLGAVEENPGQEEKDEDPELSYGPGSHPAGHPKKEISDSETSTYTIKDRNTLKK